MRNTFVLFSFLFLFSSTAWSYQVDEGKVFNDSGEVVNLYGVSWFGFETHNNVVHGLWTRNWKDMIQQIKDTGFTAVRLPFCPATLTNKATSSINYFQNPDLEGLNSLDIMDLVMDELDNQGLYILLDHHTSDCQTIDELWYTASYSEQQWIDDLVFVAERYKDNDHLVGIDLKNEPHGPATWGTGDSSTDWKLAAEKAADDVLFANPDILIFVQGIQDNPTCSGSINHWWGGNLEPVACFPLNIPSDKLVLSPHVYGPDVFLQPYFNDPTFPGNMPDIWETHFGYLVDEGYAVIIGEFGGRYGNGGDPRDRAWQDSIISYMEEKGMTNFFYWSWNPNSSDTGGILQDDWNTVWQDKVDLLHRLIDTDPSPPPPPNEDSACEDGIDNDSDGLIDYPEDPGCDRPEDDNEFNQPPPGEQELDTTVNINDDWGTGYCAAGTVTNNGSGTEDWEVVITVDGIITDLWNGSFVQSGETVTVSGASWNNTVLPGQSVEFGFCASRSQTPPPPPPVEDSACEDGIDNDNDGLTDFPDDPGCDSADDNDEFNEPAPLFACEDGIDNDNDGFIDFPDDPGCNSADDDNEFNQTGGSMVTADVVINDDWGSGYCAQVNVINNGNSAEDWTVDFEIDGTVRNMWGALYSQNGNIVTAEGVSWNNIVQPGQSRNFGFCGLR